MRNGHIPPYAIARLLIFGFLGLVAFTQAKNTGSHVQRKDKSWQGMEHRGRRIVARNRIRRRLEGKGGGKGEGKGEGKGDGETRSGSGSGGGSNSGSGSAGGSGSAINSNAWVNGEYLGCLALSEDERVKKRISGGYLACDYTITIDTSNGNAASNSSNSNSSSSSGRSRTHHTTNSQVVTNISDATDPYKAFNIEHCDSYDHLWTWDLELSCGETSNYDECHCTFAETLMEKGLLSCDDANTCPKGCTICSSCLRLLGCTESVHAGTEDGLAAMAAVFTLLVGTGFCLFFDRRRKRKRGKLNDHLMDDNSEESHGKIWMVPIDAGVPTENGGAMNPVWLAPDGTTASIDSSSLSSTSLDSEEPCSNEVKVDGDESSTLRQKQGLDQLRWDNDLFPDVLGNEGNAPQPRRVPTVPTDKTSDSDDSPARNEIRNQAPLTNRAPNSDNENDDKSEQQESMNSSSQSTDSASTMSSVLASPYATRPAVKALHAMLHGPGSEYTSDSNSSTLTNSLECEEDSI